MAWTNLAALAASVLQAARFFSDVQIHRHVSSPTASDVLVPAISHSKAARDETLPVDRDAAALLLRTSTRHL